MNTPKVLKHLTSLQVKKSISCVLYTYLMRLTYECMNQWCAGWLDTILNHYIDFFLQSNMIKNRLHWFIPDEKEFKMLHFLAEQFSLPTGLVFTKWMHLHAALKYWNSRYNRVIMWSYMYFSQQAKYNNHQPVCSQPKPRTVIYFLFLRHSREKEVHLIELNVHW